MDFTQEKKRICTGADVIRQIRDGKSLPWVYVVTPASNRENILDIYRADDLKNPGLSGTEISDSWSRRRLPGGVGGGGWDRW